MAHTVGIASYPPVSFSMINKLKQASLLFDTVGFATPQGFSSTQTHVAALRSYAHISPDLLDVANELEYLFDNGYIKDLIDIGVTITYKHHPLLFDMLHSIGEQRLALYALDKQARLEKNEQERFNIAQQISAANARQLFVTTNCDIKYTAALLDAEFKLPVESDLLNVEVIKLAINHIPVHDSQTHWDRIREFKENPDNKGRLASLKDWMNRAIRSGRTSSEINDEFESLIYQYRKSLELHEIKCRSGILQTLIVGGAELIENALKLKFSNIAKSLFSAQTAQAKLYEVELTAPGSVLAYLYKSNQVFKK